MKKSWLYDAVENGAIGAIRLGKQLRFRPSALARYLDERARMRTAANDSRPSVSFTRCWLKEAGRIIGSPYFAAAFGNIADHHDLPPWRPQRGTSVTSVSLEWLARCEI